MELGEHTVDYYSHNFFFKLSVRLYIRGEAAAQRESSHCG